MQSAPTTTKIDALMMAIAHREGYGIPGAVPTRLNNPGDLEFAHQHNATPEPVVGKDGKTRVYAKFPTVEDGLNALRVQIQLDARRGLSVAQFIDKYAPASDGNDPNSYLSFVLRAMGIALRPLAPAEDPKADRTPKLAEVIEQ